MPSASGTGTSMTPLYAVNKQKLWILMVAEAGDWPLDSFLVVLLLRKSIFNEINSSREVWQIYVHTGTNAVEIDYQDHICELQTSVSVAFSCSFSV